MSDHVAIPLRSANLEQLGNHVRVPIYERSAVTQAIVHIGVGGFFRAHQAVYLDELLARRVDRDWGYCGVGLLPHDTAIRDALMPQDGLYSVVERSAASESVRIVGSVLNHLHAPGNMETVLEKLASPDTRIVSLTITEGGYYVNEATGEFNESHPDICHDLKYPHAPACSFGVLAEAMERRRRNKLPPFTVMSCDNLQHNGDLTRAMLLAFVQRRDAGLAAWIAEHGAFPNSMVDRITPATTDEDRRVVREEFGIEDAWPVVTEPFMQWVVEDNFPGGRPAWEDVGVQMTADVLPYEKMKLRCLNASHQALCYIGLLLGYEYVHEAMDDPHIRKLVQCMMDVDVTPLLSVPSGIDLSAYKQSVVERFANPTIRDQLARIATDGSTRIPGFVLPSIVDAVARGSSIKHLSFVVATWFRYLSGEDDEGRVLPMNDALAEPLQQRARQGGAEAMTLLEMPDLFGEELLHSRFVDEVRAALASLYDRGAEAALRSHVSGSSV